MDCDREESITVDILTQRYEFRFAMCQLCKSIMRLVGLGIKCHVSSTRVERPNKARVLLECLWSRQKRSIVIPPYATSTSKGW